jgi:hypothetical protein
LIQPYVSRNPGKFLDRIDLHINVPAVQYKELRRNNKAEESTVIHADASSAQTIMRDLLQSSDDAQPIGFRRIKYRTADVCSVLQITPHALRWRSIRGKYPTVKRDGWGRIYTLEDIEKMIASPPTLDKQRSEAGKRRWQNRRGVKQRHPDRR